MRLKKSMINAIVSVVGQLVNFILNIVNRMIIIRTLGGDYTGVTGLFSNILTVLSLAELGVGTAITYSMYKPLAEKNEELITSLVNFYRKVYITLGSIVLLIGMLIIPFLKYLINGQTAIDNIEILYLLYLINTVLTYFFSYRTSILAADQKMYITNLVTCIFFIIQNLMQMLVLVLTKNFILYLLVLVCCNMASYIVQTFIVEKQYPFLNKYHDKLPDREKKDLITNIKALFMHKIGSVLVNGTDNIIISAKINLFTVAVYTNYTIITNAVLALLNAVLNSITSAIGNVNVTEGKETLYDQYKNIFFINFIFAQFMTGGFFVLSNDFNVLCYGRKYSLDVFTLVIVTINFYLVLMRPTTLVFRNAIGIFKYDKYRPIIEAFLNLVISIALVEHIGLRGVLLGTTLSAFFTYFWQESYILYKYGFHKPVREYFAFYFQTVIFTIFVTSICSIVDEAVFDKVDIVSFMGKVIIFIVIDVTILYLLTKSREETKNIKIILQRLIRKGR